MDEISNKMCVSKTKVFRLLKKFEIKKENSPENEQIKYIFNETDATPDSLHVRRTAERKNVVILINYVRRRNLNKACFRSMVNYFFGLFDYNLQLNLYKIHIDLLQWIHEYTKNLITVE
jgi:hypothetical protein